MLQFPHDFVRSAAIRKGSNWAGLFAVLILAAACGGGDSPSGPSAQPATIQIGTGNNQTGVVATALSLPLSVIVKGFDGKPVSNALVSWDVAPGSGTTSAGATRTDGNGATQITWTLGTKSGSATLTAQVGGVNPAQFTATANPGELSLVVALPDALNLGVGDAVQLASTARDQFGNEISGSTLTYSTLEAAIASVSSTGVVSALITGTARIVATSGAKADTVPVVVGAAGSSVCGTLAVTDLAVGQVSTPTSRVCLSGSTASAEYGLVTFSSSAVFGNTSGLDVYGMGLVAPTAPLIAGLQSSASTFDFGYGSLEAPQPSIVINRDAELARREVERKELAPLVDLAREEFAARNVGGFGKPAALRAPPIVGEVLQLNTQALQGCTNAAMRAGTVKAVGTRSILVADNSNPANGYADADYKAIAATFDTLVYPLGVDNFGAPTDISGYGKVVLFLTSAVNQLTPKAAGFVIGGFFFSRDLYPKTARNGLQGCAGSNEKEMFYLLVPDPNGTINENRRSTAQVTQLNLATLGHEFQHLINSSRRLYVNVGATPNEETWLDEGLSHIAEELLYFKISGFGTRDNLNLNMVTATTTQNTNFSSYMAQNFSRLYERLRNSEITSPYATDDSLSTRGATWSFLRYAAGRQDPAAEPAFFRSLVNSNTIGVANLTGVMPGGQLATFLNDWSVATFADDYAQLPQAQLDARYKFPSWNFRSIFPALRVSGGQPLNVYPLLLRTLQNNVPRRFNIAGGGANYVRFAIPANKTGVISVSTNGGPPVSNLKFSVVRLR